MQNVERGGHIVQLPDRRFTIVAAITRQHATEGVGEVLEWRMGGGQLLQLDAASSRDVLQMLLRLFKLGTRAFGQRLYVAT